MLHLPPAVAGTGVIAIVRRPVLPVDVVAETLWQSGVRAIEIARNAPDAEGWLRTLATTAVPVPYVLGAGTITGSDQAARLVACGATYVLTPGVYPDVIDWCVSNGVPIVSGAFSPTEVGHAWALGSCAVKIFPAVTGGPAHIRSIRGPFGDVPLIPVGGINADNAALFLEAGAVAVGVGEWLTGPETASTIERRATQLLRIVNRQRSAS